MSNDSDVAAPVWARTKKSGGGLGGLFGFIFFLLALFGILVLVLAGMNGWSFSRAGAQIDGVVCSVVARVHGGHANSSASSPASAPAAAAVTAAPAVAAPAPAPAKLVTASVKPAKR